MRPTWVLMLLSRVKQLKKHQTWPAVSATVGDTGVSVEAHHEAPHSPVLLGPPHAITPGAVAEASLRRVVPVRTHTHTYTCTCACACLFLTHTRAHMITLLEPRVSCRT